MRVYGDPSPDGCRLTPGITAVHVQFEENFGYSIQVMKGGSNAIAIDLDPSPLNTNIVIGLETLSGTNILAAFNAQGTLTNVNIDCDTNIVVYGIQKSDYQSGLALVARLDGALYAYSLLDVMEATDWDAGPVFIPMGTTSDVPATVTIDPWPWAPMEITWILSNTDGGVCRAMFDDGTRTNTAYEGYNSLRIVGLTNSLAFGDVSLKGYADGVCFVTNPITICEVRIPDFGYLLENHTNIVHVEIRPENVLTNVVLSLEQIYTNGGLAAFTNAEEYLPLSHDTNVWISGVEAGQVVRGVRLKATMVGALATSADFTVARVTLSEIPFIWIPGTNLWEGPDNLWGGGTNGVYVEITPSPLETNVQLEISRLTGTNVQYGIALFTNEASTDVTSESGDIQIIGVAASGETNNMVLTAILGNQIAAEQTFNVAGFTLPNVLIITNGLFVGAITNFDVRIVPSLPDEHPL